jgi:hypothetical protein
MNSVIVVRVITESAADLSGRLLAIKFKMLHKPFDLFAVLLHLRISECRYRLSTL